MNNHCLSQQSCHILKISWHDLVSFHTDLTPRIPCLVIKKTTPWTTRFKKNPWRSRKSIIGHQKRLPQLPRRRAIPSNLLSLVQFVTYRTHPTGSSGLVDYQIFVLTASVIPQEYRLLTDKSSRDKRMSTLHPECSEQNHLFLDNEQRNVSSRTFITICSSCKNVILDEMVSLLLRLKTLSARTGSANSMQRLIQDEVDSESDESENSILYTFRTLFGVEVTRISFCAKS